MSIRDYLQSRHVWFEPLLHPPGPSASRRAQSIHIAGRLVAKTVLIRVDGEYVLAVLPSTSRIDLERFAEIVHGRAVAIASEEEVAGVFGDCELGALPPFGRLYGLRTFVEASLAGGSDIVCIGNTRHEGVRLRYRDYEAIEAPERARFSTAVDPKKPRPPRRRAG